LGPHPRIVANDRSIKGTGKAPELLDDGGVIARRIFELPDRDADVGAMFVRHMLWQLHDRVGDGTTTAAVLFQEIYDQGISYIVSGGNPMQLRHHFERGMQAILNELASITVHLRGKERLSQLGETICYDPPLARLLGEIFDIIGEYGRLEIRTGRGRELEREYVEGMYWDGGLLSREMITDRARRRAQVENAAILISDLEISEPDELLPVIAMAVEAGISAFLIVAKQVSDRALSVLMAPPNREKVQVVAAKAPGLGSDVQMAALEDLSVLTGGRPVVDSAGDSLNRVEFEDLGRARRAWADQFNFGVVGGKGDPRRLRQHIAHLRAAFERAEDPKVRKTLQQRIGKLMGGSATLWIGAATKTEVEAYKELAERTAEAMRGAVREGVVPGGGVALLACRSTLRQLLNRSSDPDGHAAYRILLKAVEAPIRTLLVNAGYEPGAIIAQIDRAGPGYGFDAKTGRVVEMAQAGIFDAAAVLKAVVHTAVSSAALALTTDVLVHSRNPAGANSP
jgi:chaperonin GroEL